MIEPGPYGNSGQFKRRRIVKNTTFDFRDAIFIANEDSSNAEIYPINLGSRNESDIGAINGVVVGAQPLSLTWNEVKSRYGGSAVFMRTAGMKTVKDFFAYNVEDGFAPRGGGEWLVRDSWFCGIRDDAIEADTLLDGHVENCLFESYVSFSHRPGAKADLFFYGPARLTVRRCLLKLQPQTKHKKSRFHVDGKSIGQFFKRTSVGPDKHCSVVPVVSDSILFMPQMASRGPKTMGFPHGQYNNVTLVWGGGGAYPAEIPRGITLTRDVSVWENARRDWIAANSHRFPNRSLPSRSGLVDLDIPDSD